jgi:hypothetical protein
MHLLEKSKYIIFFCLPNNALFGFEANPNAVNERAMLKFLSFYGLGIGKQKCVE